ncbi:MAG TPA: carboxypeptidase-like regulatory domain-containing protein [Candidatus Acidoferrum sp.]|nr:carboxypeptidase-like regulatory domain-containing protein [Candidatus Acidoferrum sp.]
MLRAFIPTILLAAQFLFSASSDLAQSSPSSSCPCTLRGSVVDSVSGQPVPHALVKLSSPSPSAALTDSEGKFQFDALPAGPVTLEAEKPGFLGNGGLGPTLDNASSFQFDPTTPPATLKLTPEAIIFGQVSDENGEPLEGFTVNVLSRSPHERRPGLYVDNQRSGLYINNQRQSAVTNDEGKFRIAGLSPGSYYLEVRQMNAPVISATEKSSAPSGYSPVVYPGVNDFSAAARIKLLPGRPAQANFTLKREPFIHISGTVSGAAPQAQIRLLLVDSSDTPTPSPISVDPQTGAFATKWIPPGAYNLIALSPNTVPDVPPSVSVGLVRAAEFVSLAYAHVNAASNVSDLHLTLQPAMEIPVNIHNPAAGNSESPQPLPLAISLASKEGGPFISNNSLLLENSEGATPSSDKRMFFGGVAPGTYVLNIDSPPGLSLYAESATWGSTDLLHSDLVLDSSTSVPPIEITVRDDGATLNGTVSTNHSLAGVQVVLLSGKRKQPYSVPVMAKGRFEISGLPPGTYRVFAVNGSADFDYEDAASLAKISSKVQEITLSPKQSASINLELATVEE